MGRQATFSEAVSHTKAHDYSWCIQWFKTFSALAGDTISAQRMVILLTIAECDPNGIDQGKLAENLGMDKSALSRSLQALVQYVPPSAKAVATPLVEVAFDADDRRRRTVRLTKRGRALIRKLYGDGNE